MSAGISEVANTGVAEDQLKSFVERIENLSEEIDSLTTDRKDIYNEAGSNGFDKKILAAIIRRRKLDRAERQEYDALLELYEQALGEG